VRPDQFIITSAKDGPQGTTLDVVVVDKDDPIAQSLRSGTASPVSERG